MNKALHGGERAGQFLAGAGIEVPAAHVRFHGGDDAAHGGRGGGVCAFRMFQEFARCGPALRLAALACYAVAGGWQGGHIGRPQDVRLRGNEFGSPAWVGKSGVSFVIPLFAAIVQDAGGQRDAVLAFLGVDALHIK